MSVYFYTFIENNIKNTLYYYLCRLYTQVVYPGLAQLVQFNYCNLERTTVEVYLYLYKAGIVRPLVRIR